MKVKELLDRLNKHPRIEDHLDDEVVVHLTEPSIGPIAMDSIKSGNFGFDWERGKFVLEPESNLVRLKEKEALWQIAYDFIYGLSKDVRYYKGEPRETELARRAKHIMELAKKRSE